MAKTVKNYLKMKQADLEAELVKRGYAEEDLVDLDKAQLIAQLKSDDLEEKPANDEAEADVAEGEETSDEESESEEESEEKEEKPAKGAGKSVDVIRGEEYVRTYSAKDHGKDYLKLAEEFAAKDPRRSIAAEGQVKIIRVQYRVENQKTKAWSTLEEQFTDREKALAFRSTLPGNIKVAVLFK